MTDSNKCYIAIVNEKAEPIKRFKATVYNSGAMAKVVLTRKTKDGEIEKIVKEFKSNKCGYALQHCMNAVIQFCKKFEPGTHRVTILKRDDDDGNEKRKK